MIVKNKRLKHYTEKLFKNVDFLNQTFNICKTTEHFWSQMGTEVGEPLVQALKDFEKFPKDIFV